MNAHINMMQHLGYSLRVTNFNIIENLASRMSLKINFIILLHALENLRRTACISKDGQSWVNLGHKGKCNLWVWLSIPLSPLCSPEMRHFCQFTSPHTTQRYIPVSPCISDFVLKPQQHYKCRFGHQIMNSDEFNFPRTFLSMLKRKKISLLGTSQMHCNLSSYTKEGLYISSLSRCNTGFAGPCI